MYEHGVAERQDWRALEPGTYRLCDDWQDCQDSGGVDVDGLKQGDVIILLRSPRKMMPLPDERTSKHCEIILDILYAGKLCTLTYTCIDGFLEGDIQWAEHLESLTQ